MYHVSKPSKTISVLLKLGQSLAETSDDPDGPGLPPLVWRHMKCEEAQESTQSLLWRKVSTLAN